MSGPTRDGTTAEPVSRVQILRRERGQGNVHFPCSADHEQDWQPYPVDSYSAIICDDHTYPRGTWFLLCRGATKSRAHPLILSSLPLHINISIDVNSRFDLTLVGGAMLKSHVRFDFLTRFSAWKIYASLVENCPAGRKISLPGFHIFAFFRKYMFL